MSVTAQHAQYKQRISQWNRCIDAAAGTDAVKNKGTAYLPILGGQTESEYAAYKHRALWFGATKRTIQALLGAVFRKDADVEYPDENYMESVSLSGDTLFSTSIKLVKEIISTGRAGLVVDVMGEGLPYISLYGATSIINWDESVHDGRRVLSRVVLREQYEQPGDDEFEEEEHIQYRVLEMVNGVYQQRLFRKPNDDSDYKEVLQDEYNTYPLIPKRNGLPLDFIPCVIVNAYGVGSDTEEPPLMDLVDVNISHYCSSADLEHGAHYTALPTAWIAGFPADTVFKIGSSVAWVSQDVNAKAGFLEYTGQGLTAISGLMESKEKKMAVLGARMLEDNKRAAEAAETLTIRTSGESGALTTLVRSAGEGMEKTLGWIAEWMKLAGDVAYTFNTDFSPVRIDPQLMVALMAARQSGEITQETFLYNLQQGEILRPGATIEEEIAALDMEAPTIVPINAES